MAKTASLLLVPLFKIPIIVVAVCSFNHGFTPRNSELVEMSSKETLFSRHKVAIATGVQRASGELAVFQPQILTNCEYIQASVIAIGIAEFTMLFTLALPRLVPTHVTNMLAYTPSPAIAISIKPLQSTASPKCLPPFILGTGLVIAGALLRKWCFKAMGRMFIFETQLVKEHKLVTSGPYAYVRHPSYSGVAMIYFGLAIWQASLGSWTRESGVLDNITGKVCIGIVVSLNVIFGDW